MTHTPGQTVLGSGRRWLFVVATLAALVAGIFGSTAVSGATSAPTPIQDGQLPNPFVSGHAALYGWGAATMPDGSVIIGDIWNRRIVHFATDGTNLGVLINIPAGQDPYGLAVDPNNSTVYIGASRCCSVQKWVLGGSGYTQSVITNSAFKYPGRVAVANNGDVYIADMLVSTIFVYDSSGSPRFSFGSQGSGPGQMHQPRGMAFDNSTPQKLYVMDASNYRIDVFDQTGAYIRNFGSRGNGPGQFQGNDTRGLALDRANGWLYAVDMVAQVVHKFDVNGNFLQEIGGQAGLGARYCCTTPVGKFSDGGREDTVDGNGNLWVGDMANFRVQVFSPTGVSLFDEPSPASNPPAGAFNFPEGVGVDNNGNVVVSDTRNWRLEAFDSAGNPLWQEGIRGQGAYNPYRLNYARAVAFDPVDNSFALADTYNNSVKKFASDGTFMWQTNANPGHGNGQFIRPSGVAVGPDERVYVADSANKRIQILSSTGAYLSQFTYSLFKDPRGVAVDSVSGDIYVPDYITGQIYDFTNTGAFVRAISHKGTLPGQLMTPWSVVVDANYIYVTDTKTDLVDVFNKSDGSFAVSFGGVGKKPGQFKGPEGLAVAPNGVIYVTDTYNDRVQRWCLNTCPAIKATQVAAGMHANTTRPTGGSTVFAPTYVSTIGLPGGEAQTYPGGVAVDSSGNVFISDTGNDTIEMYAAGASTPTWTVGVRGAPIGGGTDSFENPRDLAVDSTYVYVGDTDNGLVQVLNKTDGSYVTQFGQTYRSPIGMGVGTDGAGHERILVSDGTTGAVYIYNSSFNLVLTIPHTTATEGTRDAATDLNGNIFTADYRNDRIDEYSPTGTLIAMFGKGSPNACDTWPRPYGVDVDANGHVYVASSNYEVVKEFNPSAGGSCIQTFGQKGKGPHQLFQLRRVAVGPGSSPLVYAADLWGLKVLVFNQDGSLSTTQPEIGDGVYPVWGALNEPHGVSVTSQYIYATDTVNQRMTRYNLDGTHAIVWGIKGTPESTASFNWAEGIAVNPTSGNVWVANTRNNRLDEFDANGCGTPTCAGGPLRSIGNRTGGGQITFNWPMGVTFDPAGNMYVADTFNSRIQAFSVTPTAVTKLWSMGTMGTGVGNFSHPWSVAYDNGPAGPRLLVTDTYNSRIVSLNPSTGAWNGVLPITKGNTNGKVKAPMGITVSSTGQIWIADTGNNRIEEFNFDGSFANEMLGGYGTSNAQFNAPQGIEIGPNGLLYVADVSNNRIQVFQPV